jgi:hypothetical protein
MAEMQESGTRYDQEIVDYLGKEKFDYFGMNQLHLRDFKKYSMPFNRAGSKANPAVLKQTSSSARTARSIERAKPFLKHLRYIRIQGLNFYCE